MTLKNLIILSWTTLFLILMKIIDCFRNACVNVDTNYTLNKLPFGKDCASDELLGRAAELVPCNTSSWSLSWSGIAHGGPIWKLDFQFLTEYRYFGAFHICTVHINKTWSMLDWLQLGAATHFCEMELHYHINYVNFQKYPGETFPNICRQTKGETKQHRVKIAKWCSSSFW